MNRNGARSYLSSLAIILGFVLTALASASSYSQGLPSAASRVPRGPVVAYHVDVIAARIQSAGLHNQLPLDGGI